MFELIKNLYNAKSAALASQAAESRMAERFTNEASNLVLERPEEGGFIRVDQASDREKGHLQSNQLIMIREARKAYRWDANARAALQTLTNYIMGKGVSITPKTKDPLVWFTWREFWVSLRNKMQLKQFEIPLRWLRDGEVFIEVFSKDDDGNATGKTSIRFIDPLLVKNPGEKAGGVVVTTGFNGAVTKSGVEHDANDVEKVTAYWVEKNADTNEFRKVDAKDVIHVKAFADTDQKRGESLIQPIMTMLTNYRQWLDNRIILNKMRSAIVLVRKIKGDSSQLNNIVNNLKTASNTRAGSIKRENWRGGSVLTANAGVDYEMMSPNINASDVKEDGRNIKLNMAAGTNLPEYVFGDASNANFSSSLIAESPFVKSVEFLQTHLEYFWCDLFRRVIQNAVDAEFIKGPNDEEFLKKIKAVVDLNEQTDEKNEKRDALLAEIMPEGKMETPSEIFFGCDIQWPEIVHRDPKELSESLQIQRAAGWVSDESASQKLGYDYNEEVRKQKHTEEEGKKVGNPLMGIKPEAEDGDDENDMDDEARDMVNTFMGALTPQQREQIVNAKNSQEVAAVMAGAAPSGNGNGNENQGGD